MRYRRFAASDYIVFGLLALGILAKAIRSPGPFVIPILVFGTIFLLYKYPPNRWRRRKAAKRHEAERARQRERERRKAAFRVIPGSKPTPDDEPPPYH